MSSDTIIDTIGTEALAVVLICVALFSILMYAAIYISAYQERSKTLDKLKIRQASGETLTNDEKVAIKAGESFSWGIYGVAAAIGALATMALSLVFVLMIGDYYHIESTLYYSGISIIVTIAVSAVLDYYAIHRVADGEFYAKVVRPLNEKFLAPAGEAAAKKASSLTSEEAQFAKKLFELLSAAKDDGKE